MTDAKPPLLVVRGPWPGCVDDLAMAGFAFSGLIGLSAAVAFGNQLMKSAAPPAMGVAFVLAAFCYWIGRVARRRSWYVEFHEEVILFRDGPKSSPRVTVPWSDIAWFSDRDADCVQLKLLGPVSSFIDLRIPTQTETDRVAVLALLDGHGMKRRD